MLSKEELTNKLEKLYSCYTDGCSSREESRSHAEAGVDIFWPEIERLRSYQYTIECEAQHNKNLHEEELFNSDNLLKRLNEKKAKVADLEKENERLKEAIGYLVKVPTQSYEKELARKLTDLERKLVVAKAALVAARDSRYSLEPSGGYSQIDNLVFEALKEIEGEK